jgi:hypothetical protein
MNVTRQSTVTNPADMSAKAESTAPDPPKKRIRSVLERALEPLATKHGRLVAQRVAAIQRVSDKYDSEIEALERAMRALTESHEGEAGDE